MKRFFTLLCLVLLVGPSMATVRPVPQRYATIQSALDAARAGDTILVDAGTYHENIVWPQTNFLHLIGSGNGKPGVIIDGSHSGRVIDMEWTGKGALVAEIRGFVIQNGFLDVPAHQGGRGAGIYALNTVLKISRCFFEQNIITSSTAIQNSGGGAGIHLESTPVGSVNLISDCWFASNVIKEVTNGSGTAIELDNAATRISNTAIQGNTMAAEEVSIGTVYAYASPLTVEGVRIENNTLVTRENILAGQAAIKGGAIFSYLSDTRIENLLADNNLLTPFNTGLALLGSGIYYYGEGGGFKITNSTIAGNKRTDGAPVNGTAIYFSTSDGKVGSIYNSVLWNEDNGPEIYNQTRNMNTTYSDIRGGYSGTGNINADPRFLSATDFHLQLSSPCINTGSNTFAPATDLEGNKRPQPIGSNADQGCYEVNQPAFAGAEAPANNDASVVVYPNPSKGSFKITVDDRWIGARLQVRTPGGEVMFSGRVTARETPVTLTQPGKGLYFIVLEKGSLNRTVHLIIER